MSGNEKFYVPHDDLLSLKDSVDTLDTDILALDADVQTLTTAFLLPESQTRESGNATLVNPFDSEVLIYKILSATDDRYITKARMRILSTVNPFADYKADAYFFASVAGNVILDIWMCEGKYPAYPIDVGASFWVSTRMIEPPLTKVPAGQYVTCTATSYALPTNTAVILDLWHVKGV